MERVAGLEGAAGLAAVLGIFGFVIFVTALTCILVHDFAQGLADERAIQRDEVRARDSFSEAFIPHPADVAQTESTLTRLQDIRAQKNRKKA